MDMIHTESFTLYDSMSAIEIYDPKMDLKANLQDCTTLEGALKNKIIKLPQDLSIQEVNIT